MNALTDLLVLVARGLTAFTLVSVQYLTPLGESALKTDSKFKYAFGRAFWIGTAF